jgi:HEAT repeat protein
MGHKRLLILGGVAAVLVLANVYQNLGGGTGKVAVQLDSPDAGTRDAARQKLEADRSAAALGALAQNTQHADTNVAVHALAAIGRAGSGGTPYLARVQAALGDARPEVREMAVNALGQMEGEANTASILQMLQPTQPSNVRAAAAQAVGRKYIWDGFPALLRGMRDDSPEVRAAAYAALSRMLQRDYHFNAHDTPERRERIVRIIEKSIVGLRPDFSHAVDH